MALRVTNEKLEWAVVVVNNPVSSAVLHITLLFEVTQQVNYISQNIQDVEKGVKNVQDGKTLIFSIYTIFSGKRHHLMNLCSA